WNEPSPRFQINVLPPRHQQFTDTAAGRQAYPNCKLGCFLQWPVSRAAVSGGLIGGFCPGEYVAQFSDFIRRQDAVTDTRRVVGRHHLLTLDQFSRVALDQQAAPRLTLVCPAEHLTHFGQHPLSSTAPPPFTAHTAQGIAQVGISEFS